MSQRAGRSTLFSGGDIGKVVLSTILCGCAVVIFPAIVIGNDAFLLFALTITAGIGLISGLAAGLVARLSTHVVPTGWPITHAALSGATAGGVSWLLGALVPLVNPPLFAATFGATALLATWVVLRRQSA